MVVPIKIGINVTDLQEFKAQIILNYTPSKFCHLSGKAIT